MINYYFINLQSDLDDQAGELRSADENAKKAMSDASRLAEELRQEQDHAGQIERMRRSLEGQVKELQVKRCRYVMLKP